MKAELTDEASDRLADEIAVKHPHSRLKELTINHAVRSQIDGANDGALVIREDEFRVELKVLQSVYFDADII
jgi:hypothetical protein